MKKVEIESGRLVIYVDSKDIEMLKRQHQFGGEIPTTLFSEESIVQDQKDENGRYRIDDPTNVNYIKCLAYIAHANFLEKKSDQELVADVTSGNQVYSNLKDILREHCFRAFEFSESEIEFLKQVPCIDQKMVTILLGLDFCDIIQRSFGSNLCLSIINQMGNLIDDYETEIQKRKDILEEARIEKSPVKRISRKFKSKFKRGE